ncbi:MAG: CotH kinase family protein, partial [Ferruginibacter sp.]
NEAPWGNCWKNMEVPAFFEFFSSQGENPIHQHCGLKIFGGYTRGNPEKSMKVTAKKKYGPGKFKAAVFPLKDIRTFNALVLRVSGSDFMKTRFQDMLCASLAAEMRIDHMTYQPSVLFVNGEYWGIHNVREKIDLTYLEQNHDADSASTDLLHFDGDRLFGSSIPYGNMIQNFKNLEPDNPHFIEEIEKRMDVTNYFNFMVLQIYLANIDMRGNIKFWRAGNLDGRFRWIFYDADLGFQAANLNFLAKRISPVATDWYNPTQNTFLLRKLLSHPVLRSRFIQQYCLFSATLLSDASIQQRITQFHDWLAPEMPRHLNRRTFKQSVAAWEKHVENLRAFSRIRHQTSIAHLATCFDLKHPYQLTLNANTSDTLNRICVNGYPMPAHRLSGTFFGEVPLDLSIQNNSQFERFDRWSDGITQKNRRIDALNMRDLQLTAFFRHREKSTAFQQTTISCVHPGGKKKKPWVAVQLGQSIAFPLLIWESYSGLEKRIPATKYRLVVIASDTAQWRKQYPDYPALLIQDSTIRFYKKQLQFGIADNKQQLLDSIAIVANELDLADIQFFVRSNHRLVPAVRPNTADWNTTTMWDNSGHRLIYTLLGLILIGLTFVSIAFLKRRNAHK